MSHEVLRDRLSCAFPESRQLYIRRPVTRRRQVRFPGKGRKTRVMASGSNDAAASRGFGIMDWTGKIISQGTLVKGAKAGWNFAWQTMMNELAPQTKDGSYARPTYGFNAAIGSPEFPAESGRYHLYLGNACPWCHRVLLALILRGLTPHITYTMAVDDPERASRGGWVFDQPEPVFGARDLRQVYDAGSPGYRGRCTAPLLVDRRARRLVCNESSELVRILNALSLPGSSRVDLYPAALAAEIDAVNDLVQRDINNGVYRSGFATSQGAYERAQADLYAALDAVEARLAAHRFLVGDRFTEADVRLYPTIIRYDGAYATLFKCCRRRVADYPHLSAWLRDVYQLPSPQPGPLQVSSSFDLDEARRSYFGSLFPLNPGGIVPVGPTLADLRLDRDPGRGPRSVEAIFHQQPQPVAAAM